MERLLVGEIVGKAVISNLGGSEAVERSLIANLVGGLLLLVEFRSMIEAFR